MMHCSTYITTNQLGTWKAVAARTALVFAYLVAMQVVTVLVPSLVPVAAVRVNLAVVRAALLAVLLAVLDVTVLVIAGAVTGVKAPVTGNAPLAERVVEEGQETGMVDAITHLALVFALLYV